MLRERHFHIIHAHKQLGNIGMPGGLPELITNKPEETSTDTRTGHRVNTGVSPEPLPVSAWLMASGLIVLSVLPSYRRY